MNRRYDSGQWPLRSALNCAISREPGARGRRRESNLDIDSLTHTSGEWLRGEGPDADIVISSRIRLARNLAQFPFLSRADDGVRGEIERTLHENVVELSLGGQLTYFDINQLEGVDR